MEAQTQLSEFDGAYLMGDIWILIEEYISVVKFTVLLMNHSSL